MSLSREEVAKVASLARLRLSEDEIALMTSQLAQILDYFQQLEQVDTSQIEPLAHPVDVQNVLRDDEVRTSLPREEVLANAPSHDGECYRVPAVL